MKRLFLIIVSIICILSLLTGCTANDAWQDDFYTTGTIYSWNGTAFVPLGTGGGGTNDHSALINLDYASAGHTGFEPAILYPGNPAQYLDGTGNFSIPAGGGGGNVTASANLGDNTVIRGDGGALGVQDSGVTIDDFDNLNTNGGDIDGFDINAGNDINVTNDLDVTDNADIGGQLVVTGNISAQGNYVLTTDNVNDVPSNGNTTEPISSNWAFDHYIDWTHISKGATVPGSPTEGQLFLHEPTGRKVLLEYDGSNWIPIISLGSMTVYVDKTDGTDSIDKGGAVDGGAVKTVQYAVNLIPGLVGGDVIIYINAESYDESVTVKGKVFTGNYSILIYGTLTSLATANQDSSVQGTGSIQGSITDAGAFGAYDNKLIYSSNNAEYRIIDSDSANTATIVGCWSAAPTNSYTVYDWGTDINSITIDGVNKVSLYNLKLDTLISLTALNNGVCYVYQCDVINNANVYADGKLIGFDSYFTATATHCVRVWRASYTEMARCKFYSNGAWMWGIILADNSAGVVSQGCIFDSASTSNTRGIDASLSSSCDMSQSAASGYCRLRNLGIGIASYQGGQVLGTANNQYSGNLANETATAASYGYID